MLDLKAGKKRRVKGNRRKKGKRPPRDWRDIFHRLLRVTLFTCSAVLIVSGGVLAARLLFESGYFSVDRVEIMNLRRLDGEEILAESDIRSGDNIILLDLDMIGRKIEENPWVARAEVERVFPREIVIRVTERDARAIINLGYLYYVDVNGDIFKILSSDDRLDYPVITGIDRDFMLDRADEAKALIRDAMALIDLLAERTVFTLDDISEVHVDREDGFILTTFDAGVPIRVGFSNFASKLSRLERIYHEIEPKLPVLEAIDLNVTDRVIVKI